MAVERYTPLPPVLPYLRVDQNTDYAVARGFFYMYVSVVDAGNGVITAAGKPLVLGNVYSPGGDTVDDEYLNSYYQKINAANAAYVIDGHA